MRFGLHQGRARHWGPLVRRVVQRAGPPAERVACVGGWPVRAGGGAIFPRSSSLSRSLRSGGRPVETAVPVAWPNAVGTAQPGVAAAAGVVRSDVAAAVALRGAAVGALRGAAGGKAVAQPGAVAEVAPAAAVAPGARDVLPGGCPSAVA